MPRGMANNGAGDNNRNPTESAYPPTPRTPENEVNQLIGDLSSGLGFFPDAVLYGLPKEFVRPFYHLPREHRPEATLDGQLTFPLAAGQPPVSFPFKFKVPFKQKLIVDQTLPGPVVNHDICKDTLTSASLGIIQIVHSSPDSTVSLNHGTPIPLKGFRNPIPTDPPDPNDFSPGIILYGNFVGGLTSVSFNSLYQIKLRAYLFGD